MDDFKHVVVFDMGGVVVTAHKTQAELAELLKMPQVQLISVNAEKPPYRRRRTKAKVKRG